MSAHRTVFLAGGTGLAGTSILTHLLAKDPEVRVRASCFRTTRPVVRDRRLQYVAGDLRLEKDCSRMVRGCSEAILAAANTTGAGSTAGSQGRQVADNVTMNMRMLEACHAAGLRRVVYVGSATLYQDFDGYVREDQLDAHADPAGAYYAIGHGMRFIEKMCRYWHETTGMAVLATRTSNIFGPFDKFRPEVSHFIPAIIRRAVAKADPFEVWGRADITRDVIYAEDFARAIVAILDAESISFGVFNVGSGVLTTVGDVVRWALEAAGHRPQNIKYLADKPTMLRFRALDITKARQALNWVPQVGIEEGIRRTVAWWQKNQRTWPR